MFTGQKKAILFICIVSLAVQTILMLIFSKPYLAGDEPEYDTLAANLASGRGFLLYSAQPSIDRTPVYPLFLAGIYLIFGHNIFIAKIAQLFLNSLTCIAVYLLTKRIFDRKIAFYTAVSVAVYPPLAAMSISLYSEVLFSFLFALGMLLLAVAIEKERVLIFSLSGLIFALATQTRPEIFLFPLIILITIPFLNKKKRLIKKGAFLYFATFLIALSPWVFRNYLVFHEFIPFSNKGGLNAWCGSYIPGKGYSENEVTHKAVIAAIAQAQGRTFAEKDLTDPAFIESVLTSITLKIDRYLLREAFRNISNDPVGFLKLVPIKITRIWLGSYSWAFNIKVAFSDFIRDKSLFKTHAYNFIFKSFIMLLSILIFLFACLGIYIKRNKWRESFLILLPLIYFTMLHSVSNAMNRLGLPAVPFLLIYSVCGYLFLKKELANR